MNGKSTFLSFLRSPHDLILRFEILAKKIINPPFDAEVALIRPILEARLEILQKILFAFLVELKLSKISF